ncbi:MAG: HD domain-containing protein [Lachnospiraceae bacterium]
MNDQKAKLGIGALLHDIGKVIYRQGNDRRNHSTSGYDYLKTEAGVNDSEVLNCVRYHHASHLKNASIADESLAYIVYIADNIAAFADRRKRENTEEKGFEVSVPLQSVFNILNGNQEELYYQPGDMDPNGEINYPSAEKKKFSENFYQKIRARLTDNLKGIDWTEEYLNSLLAVMEANLSYVPSSTAKAELTDISLLIM